MDPENYEALLFAFYLFRKITYFLIHIYLDWFKFWFEKAKWFSFFEGIRYNLDTKAIHVTWSDWQFHVHCEVKTSVMFCISVANYFAHKFPLSMRLRNCYIILICDLELILLLFRSTIFAWRRCNNPDNPFRNYIQLTVRTVILQLGRHLL